MVTIEEMEDATRVHNPWHRLCHVLGFRTLNADLGLIVLLGALHTKRMINSRLRSQSSKLNGIGAAENSTMVPLTQAFSNGLGDLT